MSAADQLALKGQLPCPHCDGTGAISAEQLGFGGMVLTARKLARMSQQELADEVGITRAQVANIEAGRSAVPVEAVRRYAKALHIDPVSLLP